VALLATRSKLLFDFPINLVTRLIGDPSFDARSQIEGTSELTDFMA